MKLNLASGYIGVELGQAMDAHCTKVAAAACVGSETGATLFGIGYFHNLSKQSQLQVILGTITNGDAANYILAGGAHNNNVNGASHTGLYTGIKHTF
ncbi:MAG: hypothetical protein EXR36_11235 [Betaproteobacteria bacterium]|nr:hypothetical protein [Betaproteobacteria bacterium]